MKCGVKIYIIFLLFQIHDYMKSYLGDTKEHQDFVREFLERRKRQQQNQQQQQQLRQMSVSNYPANHAARLQSAL